MHRAIAFIMLIGLVVAAPVAAIDDGPFVFETTGAGGAIPDHSVNFFPAFFLDNPREDITGIQLEITGLFHPSPADLNIWLVDPFGNPLEIMDDRGEGSSISEPGVTLIFDDKGVGQLPAIGAITSTPDGQSLLPEGPGMFADFFNTGTDAWLLVVIDDDEDGKADAGFDSFTLRAVPEPMTVSLLLLGAAAALRRKRS